MVKLKMQIKVLLQMELEVYLVELLIVQIQVIIQIQVIVQLYLIRKPQMKELLLLMK